MKKQLRKRWKTRVRLAVLDVISLATDSLTWARRCWNPSATFQYNMFSLTGQRYAILKIQGFRLRGPKAMQSEFFIGRFSKGLVVRIVGRGTMQESQAFRAAVEPSLDAGVVVFDATHCDYVDSTFLGCLIWIKKACEQSPERRFVIAASAATRVKLFSTSSLDGYFDFVDACPEPLDKFVTIDVEKLDPEELGRHVMRCHELLSDMGGRKAKAFKAVADRLAKELGEKAHKPVSEQPNRPAPLS